jgi:hypothetical protein
VILRQSWYYPPFVKCTEIIKYACIFT